MRNKKEKPSFRGRNPQPMFAKVRRGYDVESVEAYIALERDKAERAGMEQKERIRVLKADCERLTEELQVYRDREESIKTALLSATEKAEKTLLDVKFRYALELERLKLFRAKWTSAYEEIKERYNFGKDALNMESVAVSVKLELEKYLSQDFSLDKGLPCEETETEFRSESDRLGSGDPITEELKEKILKAAERKDREEKQSRQKNDAATEVKAVPAAGFSLEEAQHPTESLEEICKALGLGRL